MNKIQCIMIILVYKTGNMVMWHCMAIYGGNFRSFMISHIIE